MLCCTGIDGFSNVNRTHIEAALPVLKRNGVPYLVHAEIVGDDTEPQVTSASSIVIAHSITRGYHTVALWLILLWCQGGVYIHAFCAHEVCLFHVVTSCVHSMFVNVYMLAGSTQW